MFRRLRLRLTLLYLVAGMLLVTLVGGVAYGILRDSFQTSTDQALNKRMALEFQRFGVPPPPTLGNVATIPSHDAQTTPTSGDGGHEPGEFETDEAYNAELAAIFVLPLDASGAPIARLSSVVPALAPDRTAAQAALAQGSDRRTVKLGGDTVRLLSYRINGPGGLAVLQLGRTLNDQDRFLRQLVVGLLVFGGAGSAILGALSWWLAGRSLRPARAAYARQRAFVANASHELRTPLTLVRASADVARRRLAARDDATGELLDDVLGECDHMSRLIDDLLLLSKLDASAILLAHEPVELVEFLAEIGRPVGRLADERGITLRVERATPGLTVSADPARLRQVLLILLDNALRHTPAGGTVRLATEARGRHVAIVVEDTGAGIAPADLPHVFDRFYRADRARTGGVDAGSGLGLAIAKGLVEAQGGTIGLSSKLGAGTRAEVTLPVARRSGGGTAVRADKSSIPSTSD